MLRGCQKKIYYVKNVNGKYFDEAYLVMRNDMPEQLGQAYSTDIVAEANRIIKEATNTCISMRKRRFSLGKAGAFLLGAASSSAVIGTIALIVSIS